MPSEPYNREAFKATEHESGLFWQVWTADDLELIADEISEEQAHRIVKAVNHFDEMVGLLENLRGYFDDRAGVVNYGVPTCPEPNDEMTHLEEIDALLAQIKEQDNAK